MPHLNQVGVGTFIVQTPRDCGEVNEGSNVGQAIAGLVVEEGQAAHAVPQAQVAAIAVQDVGVEPQYGVRELYGQSHCPRRIAW